MTLLRCVITKLIRMEPPEETFPSNLTWPQFKSAYSSVRKGASRQEVSNAWRNYKSTTQRRSPVRRVTLTSNVVRGKSGIEQLPPDVRRYMTSLVPSIGPLLQRLSKTLNATSRHAYSALCNLDVSMREISLLLDRRRKYLDLHPEVQDTRIWLGIHPTVEFLQRYHMGEFSPYFLQIYVEMHHNSIKINGTSLCTRGLDVNEDLYDALGWQFAKNLVFEMVNSLFIAAEALYQAPLTPTDYILVLDKLSLYDVFQNRIQCMSIDPEYAEKKCEDLILDVWRRTFTLLTNLGVPDIEQTLVTVVHSYVNGVLDADNNIVEAFHATNIEDVRRLITQDKPLPLDKRLLLPFPKKECRDEITTEMIHLYLSFLSSVPIAGFKWICRANNHWMMYEFRMYSTSNAKVINGTKLELVPVRSNILKGDVLKIERTNLHLLSIQDMTNLYLVSHDPMMSIEDLMEVLHINGACVEQDYQYASKKTRELVTSTLNKVLKPYKITVDTLLNTPDYFSRYYKRVTVEMYNMLAVIRLFMYASGTIAYQELKPNTPYITYQRVADQVMEQLYAFYGKK